MTLSSILVVKNTIAYQSVVSSEKTTQTILSFASLKDGWHYGSGAPIKRSMLERALFVNSRLNQIGSNPTEAFPLTSGEILVVGYHGKEEIEITCFLDGTFGVVHIVVDEVAESTSFESIEDLYSFLGNIEWKSKKLSGLFTQGTIATTRNVSVVQPSASPQMGLALQLFQPNAQYRLVQPNALISEPTIQARFPANHPFFYDYGRLISHGTPS
jgi:hypothetical protein